MIVAEQHNPGNARTVAGKLMFEFLAALVILMMVLERK